MNQTKINLAYIKAAAVCAAVGDVRDYLNGVMVEILEDETRYVATDGPRLVILRENLAKDDPAQVPAQIIVPGKIVKAIKPCFKKQSHCDLYYGEGECKLSGLAVDLSFRPIDGKFPDYLRVVPNTAPTMEPGQFNPDFLADFKRVIEKAFSSKSSPVIYPNGKESPAIVMHDGSDSMIGVVMPLRGGYEYSRPDWLPPAVDMAPALKEAA